MAFAVADRVKETTAVVGTGTATLLGAATGYQSFSVIGNGNTTYYCIADQGGANWEVGTGTWSTGNTLTRTTVFSSSNANALVSFASGTKDVFVTYPAGKAVYGTGTTLVAPSGTLLPVGNGGTGVGTSTGSGSVVLSSTPTLVTPILGDATGTSLTVTAVVTGAELIASNGIILNSKAIGTTFSIPSADNAMSVGPVTIASGVTITLPSGSRWVVL